MSHNEALEELSGMESNFRIADARTASVEIAKIVEEELGRAGLRPAPRQSSAQSDPLRAKIFAAADKFVAAHPSSDPVNGFEPNAANEDRMFAWMQENGMDGTAQHHFELAFAALRDQLIPPAKPKAAVPSRVRKVNGFVVSHESLDRLSAKELERLSQNPTFVAAVEALPPR